MRSRVVGPALSHRGLFSSHPPPISFLPSVFFLLRMMEVLLSYSWVSIQSDRMWVYPGGLTQCLRPGLHAGSKPVRTSCKAPSNRDTAVPRAAVPLRGRFIFSSSSFLLLPFLPSSSSFILFFLRSSWRPPSLTPPFFLSVRRADGHCGLSATGGGPIIDGLIALYAQSRPQHPGLPHRGAPPL